MNDPLVKVEGVAKKFCRSLRRSLWYGIQDLGREVGGRRHGGDGELRPDEFWAVDKVSFELRRGECLGLIGHNGAGKTTVLRMLNGLIKPDRGRITMRGRVGALIALGAGFNPVLTGRENIYVNASILGLGKKIIEAKIDEIIEFAEIGEFIDSPVQSYSSGMAVRLGFAVAAILIRPDVLLLDEVLAVGDIGFTIKCLNTVRKLTSDAAVVFVSHNMQFISSFCTRVLVMRQGLPLLDSERPAEGIDCYYGLVENSAQTSGTGEAQITDANIGPAGIDSAEDEPTVQQGAELRIRFKVDILKADAQGALLVYINDMAMSPIYCVQVVDKDSRVALLPKGSYAVSLDFGRVELTSGKYSLTVVVKDDATQEILARVQGVAPFKVFAETLNWGRIVRPIQATIVDLERSDPQSV